MRPAYDSKVWILIPVVQEIDRVCLEARLFLTSKSLSQQDLFAIEILLREALSNAILHGCENETAQRPICIMKVNSSEVIIDVRDPGPGFNWKEALRRRHHELDEDGRGMTIYTHYATQFKFNPMGNRVMLRRVLQERIS
jgi:serine/threonine-protein kinase RsbW